VTVSHALQEFNTNNPKSLFVKKMPCPYLTADNSCTAKPFGADAHKPDAENLENFCTNDSQKDNCTRAIVYKAYLKSGGK
jgi:hypothetical protein